MQKFSSVDEYVASFPPDVQRILKQLRKLIRDTVPSAKEEISYNMPAYRQHAVLVYFAGYKHHIGFYPTGSGIQHFKEQLEGLKFSKGAIQFPLDQPLPAELVRQIVKFRATDDKERNQLKRKHK